MDTGRGRRKLDRFLDRESRFFGTGMTEKPGENDAEVGWRGVSRFSVISSGEQKLGETERDSG